MELDAWLAPFRRFWSKHVDTLERHLEKLEKVPSVIARPSTYDSFTRNTSPVYRRQGDKSNDDAQNRDT